MIIPVNDDDDDNNGTPDMDQTGTVAGEDDLTELKLSLFPPDASGTVSLTVPAGAEKVRLYETADRTTPLTQTSWPAGQQPRSVWAEAIEPSASIGAASFSLGFEPSGAGQPTTDPARATPTQFEIATEYVNQDDPTATAFAPLEPLSDGKTVIYGGSEASTSDDLKVRVEMMPAGLPISLHTWTVSRAEAVENTPPTPSASDLYQVGNIWAKPGDLTFNATVRIGAGDFAVSRKVEVGVRTDDVVSVGWINKAIITPNPAGVALVLLDQFQEDGSSDAPYSAGATLNLLANGLPQYWNGTSGVPLTVADATYLLDWLFKFSGNDDPRLAVANGDFRNADDTAIDYTKLAGFANAKTNYKLFNRSQLRFRVGDNGFNGNPTLLQNQVIIGETVDPLGFPPYIHPGQRGPAMTAPSPVIIGGARVSSIVDGSPDETGIRVFNTVAGLLTNPRRYWENIGSRLSFYFDGDLSGNLTRPVIVAQPYPTYYVYLNGKLHPELTAAQAASALGNFHEHPYPFGAGGRDGDAQSEPAPDARIPQYTVP